jgi:circadian clock protein KaiB
MSATEDSTDDQSLRRFEEKIAALDAVCYELTLFVSGASDLSARAIANARQICETHLAGRYDLSVVDVHEDPVAILGTRVLAAPTLVKSFPLPVRLLVGDLSHTDKVLSALGLARPADAPTEGG